MRRYFPCAGSRAPHAPTRWDFIYSLGASLGSAAFTSLLAAEEKMNPLAPKPPQWKVSCLAPPCHALVNFNGFVFLS